jgi:hypothetical protein
MRNDRRIHIKGARANKCSQVHSCSYHGRAINRSGCGADLLLPRSSDSEVIATIRYSAGCSASANVRRIRKAKANLLAVGNGNAAACHHRSVGQLSVKGRRTNRDINRRRI